MDYSANQRVKEYLTKNNISQEELSLKLKVHKTTISAWFRKVDKREIPIKHLIVISELYPELEFNYLLNGKRDLKTNLIMSEPNPSLTLLKEEKSKTIKYYEVEGSAGKIEMFDPGNGSSYKEIVIPGFGDCDIALNVWGDSMEPVLCNGCIAICKEVNKDIIDYGYMYFIVTVQNNRMFKYVKKSDSASTVLCISANDFYDPFEISRDDIIKLYIVKGHIERSAV